MCSIKIFDYKLNAELNEKVFNLDLKTGIYSFIFSNLHNTQVTLYFSLNISCSSIFVVVHFRRTPVKVTDVFVPH